MDCYAAALAAVPDGYRWAAYIGGATFLSALVRTRSWAEADRVGREVAALTGHVSSARAQQRLRTTARTARAHRAPSSLQGPAGRSRGMNGSSTTAAVLARVQLGDPVALRTYRVTCWASASSRSRGIGVSRGDSGRMSTES